jgi:diguanylate cyclase (GGDEF)-like protein/PAS domain S-box-containing protein
MPLVMELRERIAGIVVADATAPGCPMTYVSPGFEELTGYSAAEILGGQCSVLQGPDTDPRSIDVMRQAIAEGREAYVTLLNYRRDGTPFWNEVALAAERDNTGRVVRYLGVQKDVTARMQTEKRIQELAYLDSLTGLPNRAALTDELPRALLSAAADDQQVALLFIDIDDFKRINDTHGHAAGDAVLCTVAERLRGVVRGADLLARPGGDEFLLLVHPVADVAKMAAELATRAVDCMREPVVLEDGLLVQVRASVGVSCFPRDARSVEELLRHADRAMYDAKGAGKDRFHLYRPTAHKTGSTLDDAFDPAQARDELQRILSGRLITSVFQPIVTIATDQTIAYEALSRGPAGSILERPDRLFAAARHAGHLEELDWLCRIRAVAAAMDARLGHDAALFVNCEPSAVGSPCPPEHLATWARAQDELQLVLEITERAVTDRPAELSRLVDEHRAAGRGIALDDLGADVRSLALLPFIAPDVIKLDLRLVQDRPSTEQAAIVSALQAESERTGSILLAEGIETDTHRDIARSLGATLGQGWRWGRPGPLPARRHQAWRRPSLRDAQPQRGRTPFEVVAAQCPTAEATKSLLLPMSHHLETVTLGIGEGAVLLSAFQDAKHFTPRTIDRYVVLARGASLVGALGVGLNSEPAPGIRGAHIDPDDPLTGEWSVIVIGPHFAGALVAQDLGSTGREADRRFVFATTYRRALVVAAARTLLERLTAVDAVPRPVALI